MPYHMASMIRMLVIFPVNPGTIASPLAEILAHAETLRKVFENDFHVKPEASVVDITKEPPEL